MRINVRQKRPDFCGTKDCFFYHDNAPARAAISVYHFLAKNGMTPLEKVFQQWQLRLDKYIKLKGEYVECVKVVLKKNQIHNFLNKLLLFFGLPSYCGRYTITQPCRNIVLLHLNQYSVIVAHNSTQHSILTYIVDSD